MRENRFLRAEKALLTILKIDEKNAAEVTRSSARNCAGATGSASASNRTMLDVILGGGTKALRFTSNSIFTVQRHPASTESRP